MKCPQCGETLEEVQYPSGSMLNRDQWRSQIAGEYYCEACPDNGRAKNGGCYWWAREVAESVERKEQGG